MIKIVPKDKSPGPDGFSQIIREELIIVFLKCIHKIAEGRTLPKSFYETNITMISIPDKGNNKKKNLKTISLINIDTKILNKILANRIEEHIKEITHHNQVKFIKSDLP